MTITAKNIGRINVWPTYGTAREADTEESKFVGQMTVWRTSDEARANISHEEEGGVGGLDWVPENAVIHIDLVGGDPQGRAWVAGTGEVAVDTLLGGDANADGFSSGTIYDPEALSEEGYELGSPTALIGAARAAILADVTFVVRFSLNNGAAGDHIVIVLGEADGESGIEVDLSDNTLSADGYSYGGDLSVSIADIVNFTEESTGIKNNVAVTIAGSRFELAVNGSTPVVAVLADADRPAADPFVAAIVKGTKPIQSVTIYDPLPSTAGLSELSEVA